MRGAWTEASSRILSEDSSGNMRRFLGLSPGWASFFQEEFGKLAFPAARWIKAIADIRGERGLLTGDPAAAEYGPGPDDADRPNIAGGARPGAHALTSFLRRAISFKPGEFMLIPAPFRYAEEMREMLKVPQFLKTMRDVRPLSREELTAATQDAHRYLEKKLSYRGYGEVVLRLSDGSTWRRVSDEEFYAIGDGLGNCGEADDEMYVLFDRADRPHVAASYESRSRGVDQVVGHGNSVPARKYRPAIDALLTHLGATLTNGERSLGCTFAGGRGRAPEAADEGASAWRALSEALTSA